ncbi:MAG TPA: GNAT family N-acetyltransferase [Actinophytocola sp.]|jgi:GNAT superfamily N-acetyltransferase|nr:GNAT family N-acetyltransferase [Actinophytocola sp.]
MRNEQLRVEPLAPAAAADPAAMTALSDLVNEVYAVAEDGLWLGGARTGPAEMARLTRAGQIVVARLGEKLAGCVRLQQLDDELGEFGMLAAAPAHRGTGVGRALVRFAEEHAGRPVMQLELLVPREWSHPSKEFLAAWYGRLGYRLVRVGTVGETYPELAPLLATPCDFRIYRKELRNTVAGAVVDAGS